MAYLIITKFNQFSIFSHLFWKRIVCDKIYFVYIFWILNVVRSLLLSLISSFIFSLDEKKSLWFEKWIDGWSRMSLTNKLKSSYKLFSYIHIQRLIRGRNLRLKFVDNVDYEIQTAFLPTANFKINESSFVLEWSKWMLWLT